MAVNISLLILGRSSLNFLLPSRHRTEVLLAISSFSSAWHKNPRSPLYVYLNKEPTELYLKELALQSAVHLKEVPVSSIFVA